MPCTAPPTPYALHPCAQASEQLALTHARLQEYDIAASILEKVVGRVPNDADAWRVGLGGAARGGEGMEEVAVAVQQGRGLGPPSAAAAATADADAAAAWSPLPPPAA